MFRILSFARGLAAITLAILNVISKSDARFRSEMRRRGVSDKYFDYLGR